MASSVDTPEDWAGSPWEAELRRLAALDDGWAGDGKGRAVNPHVLKMIHPFLISHNKSGITDFDLWPTVEGGVTLIFTNASKISTITLTRDPAASPDSDQVEGHLRVERR